MAIISKFKPAAIDDKLLIYESFAALRAITNATTAKKYWLLNNDFNMIFFLSDDTTSPESLPNTVVTINNQRLKLIGSE